MKGTLIKMKNNNNLNLVKKILLVAILLMSITSVSAFCVSQGYILDSDDGALNATKVNIVCKRAGGDIISQDADKIGYLFPFGDWYDDCTYCDLGIYVNAFVDDNNLFGEFYNKSCNEEIKICHTNLYLNQITEEFSTKEYYDAKPDVGPLVEGVPKTMPKSNESPQTKVPEIRKDFYPDYTKYYVIGGIILVIVAFFIVKKYVK